jgi:ABC-2 type transport system permease protein
MLSLFIYALGLNIKQGSYFRVSFYLQLIAGMSYAVTIVLFWQYILSRVPRFVGWDTPSIMLFLAFSELFFGINMGFLSVSGKLWYFIRMGLLDNYLVKPLDPRISIIINYLDTKMFLKSIPGVLFFTYLAVVSGWRVNYWNLVMGGGIAFLATILFAVLQMAASNLVFWFGSIQAIDEAINSLYEFSHYPLNMLPGGLYMTFTIIFPLVYIATVPAQIAAGKFSASEILIHLLIILFLLIIWLGVNEFSWRAGLRRYESYGG